MMKQLIVGIFLITVLMSFQTSSKTQSPPAKNTTQATDMKTIMARGKLVYLQQCLACHQVDGGGVPHLNAPLDGASAVIGKDKQKIITVVLAGMKGGEIDGETYSNPMAPHKELTDQQIADVLTYIRNSWTNKASAVSPAEVKAVRAKIK
jgi:mono/diheme cytochrome c family protein